MDIIHKCPPAILRRASRTHSPPWRKECQASRFKDRFKSRFKSRLFALNASQGLPVSQFLSSFAEVARHRRAH